MWTNTETTLGARVDALLIRGAGIVRRTVDRLDETVVGFTVKVGRTATRVAVQTNEIARAVVVDTTDNLLEAQLVGIALVSRWTVTLGLVILR